MAKVCHFTSAHQAFDTRILLKQCLSLAQSNHEVFLVAQHPANEVWKGVSIIGLKRKSSAWWSRVLLFTWRVFYHALKTRAKVYHFHDPELIPFGFLLRLLGKKVIYDVHENTAMQILDKRRLPGRLLILKLFRCIEWLAAKSFFLILAEHSYQAAFAPFTKRMEVVLNMPDNAFLSKYIRKERHIEAAIHLFYVGGVFMDRGIHIVVAAMARLKAEGKEVHFHCVGPIDARLEQHLSEMKEMAEVRSYVHFYGPERLDVAMERSTHCHIGLSMLMPLKNYMESYSTKIFEYMAVGLPVITANFPLYRDVIEKYGCGLCVPATDPDMLAEAITQIADNPELAIRMGANGMRMAREKFNWQHEAQKLLAVYQRLIDK